MKWTSFHLIWSSSLLAKISSFYDSCRNWHSSGVWQLCFIHCDIAQLLFFLTWHTTGLISVGGGDVCLTLLEWSAHDKVPLDEPMQWKRTTIIKFSSQSCDSSCQRWTYLQWVTTRCKDMTSMNQSMPLRGRTRACPRVWQWFQFGIGAPLLTAQTNMNFRGVGDRSYRQLQLCVRLHSAATEHAAFSTSVR